jgi:hypothetical protein
MLKIHVAERLAVAAGIIPPERPARRWVSLAIVVMVLAGVVGLMGLYLGVREIAQPGSPEAMSIRDITHIAPAAGPDKLMSIEEMRRRAGQD